MVQSSSKRQQHFAHTDGSNANVTSAVGMEETAGRIRARKYSFFTQTILWFTGLVCVAFLLGSLVQAWSDSQLEQKVQLAQQQLKQEQARHDSLVQTAQHYKDPAVVESEARQQLGYARPGDHVVIVVPANDSKQTGTQQNRSSAQQQSFWQDWWHLFFGE
jgi:cell division protein FtsB